MGRRDAFATVHGIDSTRDVGKVIAACGWKHRGARRAAGRRSVITRIAPTPSGFLHAGNAVNFLLTDWLARTEPGSTLHLRIDDMNLVRVPPRFLDDIFWAVDWLGISVTHGPSGPEEFRQSHSQLQRVDEFRQELDPLLAEDLVFGCRCSRATLLRRGPGVVDPCLGHGLAARPGESSLRFRSDRFDASVIAASGVQVTELVDSMGDFIVWRRDDLPSYQLASVVLDRELAVDTVVRGRDLAESTAAQLSLAGPLGADRFTAARFVHHDLLTDEAGAKMSKRDGADALRSIAATAGGRSRLWRAACTVGAAAGIAPP